MEFFNNLRIIRKHIWLVVLTTLVAGASAAVIDHIHFGRTVYTSSAVLVLNPNVANRAVVGANLALDPTNRTTPLDLDTLTATYDTYIDSPYFVARVIQRYGLTRTAADLVANLTTSRIPTTVLYKISVTGGNPTETARDAQSLANGFIADDQQNTPNAGPLDPTLTASGSAYWAQRIASIARQLTAVFDDQRLTLDQKYSSVVPLQNALADAQANQAKLTPAANPPAAKYLFSLGPDVLTRTTLVANIVLFALLGGFVVGIALALLREYLDASLHDADEAAEALGVPVLASIGLLRGRSGPRGGGRWPVPLGPLLAPLLDARWRGAGTRAVPAPRQALEDSLVTLSRPFDSGSEGFRNLRTGIAFAGAIHTARTIVITSALPREGKSVVAANLAIVMAQAGERVILVDANMRAPVQHALFGLPGAAGLSTLYLGDEHTLRAAALSLLQPTPIPYLRLLDAGQIAPNPAELLASTRTAAIVETLAEQADIVIIDTPAMGLLTDAVILASHADGTVLVASARATRRDLVKAALGRLAAVNARVLGVVLNKADVPGSRAARYYRGARSGHIRAVGTPAGTTAAMSLGSDGGPAARSRGTEG